MKSKAEKFFPLWLGSYVLNIMAASIYVSLVENAAAVGSGYFLLSLELMVFWFLPMLFVVRRQTLRRISTGILTAFGIYTILMITTLVFSS